MSSSSFFRDESGAATVDFVVITAAIVGLGIAVTSSVRTGVCTLGYDVNLSLTGARVAQLGTLGTGNDTYGGACGGTPEHPVMDCGTVWTFGVAGSITGTDGQTYYVNDSNVLIDPYGGGPMPLLMNAFMDGDGNFVMDGPYDMAGRLVDNSGVPLPAPAPC